MSDILADIRGAWRQLRARPVFTLLVVTTLGLTIGLTTAVFSVFDAVLLRPFPYEDPDRLVRLRTFQGAETANLGDASLYEFEDWQRRARSFRSTAAWVSFRNTITSHGPAQSVEITCATPELFSLLGVTPQIGRTFTARENVLGGDVRKVVLSHGLWQQTFSGSRAVLGRTIQLRGQSYEVIGVLPPRFEYPGSTDVWIPLMARYATYEGDWWKRRDARVHGVTARLRPDATMGRAQVEMETIARDLAREYPETNRDTRIYVQPLRNAEAGEIRPYVLGGAAAVAMLFLLGCVNLGGLFVARAAARARDMAVRAALGAERHHVVRQLTAESVLYASVGGLIGVAVAALALRTLDALVPVELPTWMRFSLDGRTLTFLWLGSLLAALVFGLTPLLHQARPNLDVVLRQGGRGGMDVALTERVRRVLIIVQVALAVTLLAAAGLMTRSLMRLAAVDTGIRTEGVIVATVTGTFLPNATPEEIDRHRSSEFQRMRDALAALPGVQQVSGGFKVPFLDIPEERLVYHVFTRQRPTPDTAYRGPSRASTVMPGFFAALGTPIVKGRDFTDADTIDSQPVMIISRRAAERLFPGEEPLGQQVRWGADPYYWLTVIGIIEDTVWHPAENSGIEVYPFYRQFPSATTLHFVVSATGGLEPLLPAVRRTLRAVNPDFVVERVVPLEQLAGEALWQRRLWSFMFALCAALALLLTAVGLFGVMSYLVTQRTREFGVRLAIGATRTQIVAVVLRHALWMAAVGGVCGLLAALLAGRYLQELLFGVSPFDAVTFIGVPILLGVTLGVASAVPAWRASRVDPMVALRDDV